MWHKVTLHCIVTLIETTPKLSSKNFKFLWEEYDHTWKGVDYLGGGSAQIMGFPGGISGKESACRCRRYKSCRLDPWSERSPGEGNDNPLQYSCLGNPMDRGAWQAIVHGVATSGTWPSVWVHTPKLSVFEEEVIEKVSLKLVLCKSLEPLACSIFLSSTAWDDLSTCLISQLALESLPQICLVLLIPSSYIIWLIHL